VTLHYFDQITAIKKNAALLLSGSEDRNINQALFKSNVEIINLELSSGCNRKCDYCPVKTSSRSINNFLMDESLFLQIVKELALIRYENRISLNLYNEPLLDKTLSEKVALIKRRLPYCHVSFNSNGDKLDRAVLSELSDAGLDYICVTLHPPPGECEDRVTVSRRVANLFRRLGVTKQPDYQFSKGELEFRVQGVRIKIQWPNWREEGTDRGGTLKTHQGAVETRVAPCQKPFREFTIFYDGSVQPCCEAFHDEKTNLAEMGSLSEGHTIFDIYAGESLSKFRRGVFVFGEKEGICKTCSSSDFSKFEDDQRSRMKLIKGLNLE